MKFSVPEILTIILIAVVVMSAFLALAKYLIRYAVKFYIKLKRDDSK